MTIDELNAWVDGPDFDEFVRVCEARQCKDLSRIADDVCARGGVRLVLVAGGSSAGKTTTAKRLATQLRVNGIVARHLSTDDYFVGDARNPRDENGELDYETVEAVDAARLAADVNALLAGKPTRLRLFDFQKHDGYDARELTTLPEDGCLILEGLHALNPKLTADIPDGVKFGVFAEPVTQPELMFGQHLPSSHARLLRRLVRDNQFRKMNPVATFHMWPKVLAGEKRWIEPFRHLATATFDTALPYELTVLKCYVGGLIERVVREEPDNGTARFFSELLSLVRPGTPAVVPFDSILRETIGSSVYEY